MSRKKENDKIEIAFLKDYKIEDIVLHHLQMLKFDEEGDGIKRQMPNKDILYQKYEFLLHLIITRSKADEKGLCTLNAEFFRDHIFNDHYNDMLRNLCLMGIIDRGTYKVGEHSTTYLLTNWGIDSYISKNKKYIKWSRIIKEKWIKKEIEITPFTEKYIDSLKCLNLVNKDKAIEFLNETIEDKESHSFHYKIDCIERFDNNNLCIYKIDKQNRIYHYLTSLPKELRTFFNIKYELDIANSHPLLMNRILIKYYNINNNILNIIKGEGIYHYDVENLRKVMKDNDIDCTSVPDDVFLYILRTQNGMFYDDFIEEFGDIERDEVKKKVFSQVFYSHIDDKFTTKFKKAFIKRYPNVWEVLQIMKKETDDKFPHYMMSLESALFRHILNECWEKGYKVINLHDALVVLDVEENDGVSSNDYIDIIKDVYSRYGLFPKVKIEIGEE